MELVVSIALGGEQRKKHKQRARVWLYREPNEMESQESSARTMRTLQ